jgi:uncharacterized protein (DUF433 family)
MTAKSEKYYVLSTPGICGGKPRLYGTRMPVWGLVRARLRGASDRNILRMFPTLSRGHLHAAWAYYDQNQALIDRQIVAEEL